MDVIGISNNIIHRIIIKKTKIKTGKQELSVQCCTLNPR